MLVTLFFQRKRLSWAFKPPARLCAAASSAYLPAAAHGELLEDANVTDEKVHQPEFVRKAHEDEETSGVQSHAEGLLLELLAQVHSSREESKRR